MVLGCFPLKSKKKRGSVSMKRLDLEESKPTALPEPPKIPSRNLQSAPPSFRTRVKPIQSNNGGNGEMSSRARVMSAPSSIHGAAERDLLAGVYHDEQDEQPRDPRTSTKESSPQPLPLPSPRTGSSLKNWGSFKSFNGSSGRLSSSAAVSGPLPLPPSGSVRSFSYDEVMAACNAFSSDRCVMEGLSSVMYMASFGDEASTSGLKKVDATVVRLHVTTQSIREFINEVNTLASLQHQNLCKLVGYHARDGSDTRMLVYERLALGSLDRLLHGRSDGPPLDWNTRMKIALCAAQGLTFLHEEGPFQAMYNEFSTANIQVDKDFSAKLSGYGCAGHAPETETSNSSALANLSVETLERGLLTPKSNVWSYGIVLLEMLTGRKNMDGSYPKEERNLVKWSRAFLADDCRLSLIMDPQLKGRFPAKAARSIADIAQKCLQVEPSERPDEIVQVIGNLKTVQDALFQILCRLREAMFPGRLPFQGMGGPPPPFMGPYPEPPPPFGPRQYPASPDRYHSPVGPFHERHCHGPGFDRPPGPGFDRPPSPMSWTPQPGIDGHPGGMVPPDVNHGFALRNEPIGSENPVMTSANVEIVIPQAYLGHVYGENCSNLNYIKQVSGANVVVHDPKAGTTEGLVVVSGTSDQAHFAQSLLHAFILCGQS